MNETEIGGLTLSAWITIVLIGGLFLSLSLTKIKAWAAFSAYTMLLFITNVLDAKQTFAGFSSSSVVIVALMFVVIAGLTYTGVLQWMIKYLMGQPRTISGAIIRVMLPVAALSAFLSNTTVVALFMNIVKNWSRKLGISPSKLLIPLSYASGMGGICTLIGTPPNLIISGFYTEETGQQLSIFIITGVGLFCLVVGVLSVLAMQKLLPTRECPDDKMNVQGATVELKVSANSHLVGLTVGDLHIPDNLNLMGVISFDGEVNSNVQSKNFLLGEDTLVFSGDKAEILTFAKNNGLTCSIADMEVEPQQGGKTFYAALVMIAMVLLSATNVMPLLQAASLAAIVMVVIGCCTTNQAFKSIDWQIVIIFSCSIAIGTAIEQTGLAEKLSSYILHVCGTNPYVVLTAICLVSTFVTEFISNTACGAMFYPIAMSAAHAINANPLTFAIALMVSVSSSFATPIGSPTHMLVYIPGGYRFTDFTKIGLWMNLIILAANVFITTLIFPFAP
ncbi:MAG: SLC13 family permease [Bacteroidaceae bacterium]|nr:SLC13 family permease [Bacteroidaceae bacterium]